MTTNILSKWVLPIVVATAIALSGCMAKVLVDRRPNIALPIYGNNSTNPVEYVIVDQGYQVRYWKLGFNTDIEHMSAEITTNKTVNFQLGGLHTTSPTNSITIKLEDLLKIATLFRGIDGGILLTNQTNVSISGK